MRTEAILFTSGGTKEKPVNNRMDRMLSQFPNDSAMGFGKEKISSSQTRFKETYAQVAQSNSAAKQTDETPVRNDSCQRKISPDIKVAEREKYHDQKSESTTIKAQTNDNVHSPIQNDSGEDAKVNGTENVSNNEDRQNGINSDKQASEIIIQALFDISDALQLNIVPGLDQVSFNSASEDTVEQLTQIVHDLKTIINALDMAVSQDQSIDTGKQVITSKNAEKLVTTLKSELFKIEIGINMLGKSEDVQNQLAQKMDIPFSSGIPQATDPSLLSMSSEQTRKLFSEVLGKNENSSNVSQLVKKLNELVKESLPDNTSVKIQPVLDEKSAISEVTPFNAQTFRAMLKIEMKEKVSVENTDAAEKSGKLDLPESANGVIAKDPAAQPLKLSEEILAVTEIAAKTHQNQNSVLQEIRTPVNLTKTLEQSVVNQITDKLNTAVRSGITEVRVQLRPEALGEVTLKIRIEGDVVTAKMQVENQQVKAIVENNFQSLKDSLAQHNLQTGSLEVNVQTGGKHPDTPDEGFFNNDSQHHPVTSHHHDIDNTEVALTDEVSQMETGRRFGNNTVEYFG